jgi:glycosyltransferase involved in cell wall biosynthesis
MGEPSVSVVITAWNADRFIGEAIASVHAQTRTPEDLIVVDDGSTDDTAATAGRQGATVLRCEHRGIGPSRNAGIAASPADLIAFLDADDLWHPTKLEQQVAVFADRPEVDVVYCMVDEFLDRATDAGPAGRPPKLGVAAALPSGTMVRRRLFDRVGLFPSDPVGEWVRWFAGVRRSAAVEQLVPEVLVRRRIHDDNNSARHEDGPARFLAIAREHRQAQRGTL